MNFNVKNRSLGSITTELEDMKHMGLNVMNCKEMATCVAVSYAAFIDMAWRPCTRKLEFSVKSAHTQHLI